MKRISIPEYAQRLSHLTTLGGQHGQESEEGEEGEERSEEDCEEDPQGREEEEVSLAFERIAGGLMPARHSGLQGDLLPKSRYELRATVDERGCRRDIRSNGWIEFSSLENRSGRRKQSFLRSVRIFWLRNFIWPKVNLRPGRDLVLTCSPTPSSTCRGRARLFHFPPHIAVLIVHRIPAVRLPGAVRSFASPRSS
jgi:hypothetical protein